MVLVMRLLAVVVVALHAHSTIIVVVATHVVHASMGRGSASLVPTHLVVTMIVVVVVVHVTSSAATVAVLTTTMVARTATTAHTSFMIVKSLTIYNSY